MNFKGIIDLTEEAETLAKKVNRNPKVIPFVFEASSLLTMLTVLLCLPRRELVGEDSQRN